MDIVEETEDNKVEDNKIDDNEPLIADLSEVNIAAISRERSETISKQLTEDPKMVTKLFDELTKTFETEEKVKEEEQSNVEVEVEEETSTETVVTESDDVNLNNSNASKNANKKKRNGKKK